MIFIDGSVKTTAFASLPPVHLVKTASLRSGRSAHALRRSLGWPSTRSACQTTLHWIHLSWPPWAPPQLDLPPPSVVTVKRGLPERRRSRIRLPVCHHCLSPTCYYHRIWPTSRRQREKKVPVVAAVGPRYRSRLGRGASWGGGEQWGESIVGEGAHGEESGWRGSWLSASRGGEWRHPEKAQFKTFCKIFL